MSRDGGFSIGDRFTRTLYDVRLVRATRKAGLAVLVAWDAIVDASWEAGERVTFEDAVDVLPYEMGDTAPLKAALVSAGLLDATGLIREESWSLWFGVAYARREATRERGRRYNERRRNDVDATSHNGGTYATVPTVRPTDITAIQKPKAVSAREAAKEPWT